MSSRLSSVAALVLVAGLLIACSAPNTRNSVIGSTTTPVKPLLKGLLSRDGPVDSTHLSLTSGWVVNVNWSDLQPSQGAPIAANNAIDQAITQLHTLNPSGGMGLKVRLFAGIHAPDWAKSLGGAPVSIHDPVTGTSGTIGRFWTASFGSAYVDLENKLAAKYDSAPEIREITISRCTTVFSEPFIRDTADATSVSALLAAGYTEAADQQCQKDEVTAHAVWQKTHSDLSFNPYQVINANATTGTDEAFTESMMAFCRTTLGSRCVLENNSLRSPVLYQAMYTAIQKQGPPISFQTAVITKVGNLDTTLQYAASLGANSVELPSGYTVLANSTLSSDGGKLAANPSP